MADNEATAFSLEELLAEPEAPVDVAQGFSLEELLAEPEAPVDVAQGFSLEELLAEPEVDDGRGFLSATTGGLGTSVQMFKDLPARLDLQASSSGFSNARQYIQAFADIDAGAEPKDLDTDILERPQQFGPMADLDPLSDKLSYKLLEEYKAGDEQKRQELRDSTATEIAQLTERTMDQLGSLKESEARTREFAPAVAGVTDIRSLADFRDWLGYSIGAGAKQILPIMSAGFVAGPSGALGVGTTLAATETIGNRLNFIQDVVKDLPPDEQATAISEYLEKTGDTTAIVALTSGSLDLAGPVGSLLRRRLTKDLGKEVVERTGLDILKGIPKELGKDMLEEGITGGLQETTQLAGKRATGEQTGDLITKENIKDIVDAAAAEAAGGIAGTSINVGADVLRQRAIKARRRNADQPRTRPEWTPVVSAYANMDMGKTEEEIYTRVGEVIADFGNEAATAYLSQVYGIEYTPTAEQEVEVLKGPGQIDSEPVELVSQVLDDVENSEWLADLDSEREATFQAAAELEEVGAEEVVAEVKGMNLTPQGEAAGVDPVLENDIDAGVGPTLGGGIEIDTGVGPALGEGIEAVPGNVDVISNLNDQGTLEGIDRAGPKKRGRPVGTGQQNDTVTDLRKDQDAARKRKERVSDRLLDTIETGQQKILTNKKYAVQGVPYFATEEEFTEYDYNQAIADIQADYNDVAGLEEQVRDIALMTDTDMDAAIDNLVAAGYNPQRAKEFTKKLKAENAKKTKQNEIITNLEGLRTKRVEQIAAVIDVATDPKLSDTAAQEKALATLQDSRINPDERALAEETLAGRKTKEEPLGAIPVKTGPTPMFIGEEGLNNLANRLFGTGKVTPGLVSDNPAELMSLSKLLNFIEGRQLSQEERDIIRQTTGWFEGIDGKWRLEISDELGQFSKPLEELVESPVFGTPTVYKLGDIYSHPLLYEVYPEAANIDFVYRGVLFDFGRSTQGGYDGKNTIQITPYADDPSSTLLHELQHWVQQTEGFAEGGNQNSVIDAIMGTFEAEKILTEVKTAAETRLSKLETLEALIRKVIAAIPDVELQFKKIKTNKQLLREKYDGSTEWLRSDGAMALLKEEDNLKQKVKDALGLPENILAVWDGVERQVFSLFAEMSYSDFSIAAKLESQAAEHTKEIAKLQAIESNDKETIKEVIKDSGQAYELYQRLAGEVEARNTQKRQLMTVQERLKILPDETESRDPENQIVVIGDRTFYPPATVMELLDIPETETLATQDPLFGDIENVETAAEAAQTIIIDLNRTPFERGLARVLKPVLDKLGTTFVIVKDPAQITNPNIVEIWATVDGRQLSAGVFDPTNNIIYIDEIEGLQPRVVLHEMIHAATVYTLRRYFTDPESVSENARSAVNSMIIIMDSVGQYYQTLVASDRNTPEMDKYYDNTNGFSDIEEFVTYGLTGPALQTMLLNMAPVSKSQLGYIRTAFSNFAETIGRLIGRPSKEYSAFEELIDLTGRVAAETIRNPKKNAGKVVQAKAKIKKQNAAQKAQAVSNTLRSFLNKSRGIVNSVRNPEDGLRQYKAMFEAMGSKAKRASLAVLTNNMLITISNFYKIRSGEKVLSIVNRLIVFRSIRMKQLKPNLDKWNGLNRNHKDTSVLLEDTIHLSTLLDVLIYDTDTKKLINMAQSKLQDDGRDTTDKVKYSQGEPTGLKSIKFELQQMSKNPNPNPDEQTEMDRLADLLKKREEEIEEVFGVFDKMKTSGGGSTAVELYSWALQEYRNDFEEQYALLIENLRTDTIMEGTETDKTSPKGKLMANLVASYQEARLRKVYAPLMRNGNWGVRINPGAKDTVLYMFENEAQQIEYMNFYQDRNPKAEVVAVNFNQEGRSFRDEMVADTERLRTMLNQIDELSQGNAAVADELKDSIYQIYLLTLPEGNMRKKYLRRRDRLGYSNDAYRSLVTTKISNINQLSRMKYGRDIRNALSEGRGAIKTDPTKFQISRDPKKYKGEKPKESKIAILNEIELRATTELAPPMLKGLEAFTDRATRLGTKAGFVWLMSQPSSALIQPTQLATFGFGALHAEFGARKTAAMAAKYIKNFLTVQALSRNQVGENGTILDEKGQAAIRNSKYVNNSKIKDELQAMWDIGELHNIYGSSNTQDVLSLRDPEEIRARAKRGPIARGVSRPVDTVVAVMTFATQLLERVSREVFFLSAAELAYERVLKAGATGRGAIEAAAHIAMELTNQAMFDYSNYNKPRLAKTSVGRMAFQFATYRLQATGYLIKNGYNAIFNSDFSKEEKRKASIRFFDTLAMNTIVGGVTATLGYTAFVALVDGIRDALRPEYDDEDEDGLLYDMTDPNNALGLRSFDLYIRGSFIPRYFGPGSSIAKMFGLEDETAELLALSVEVGPISALTDWNIQPRLSLDAMWFSDYGQKTDSWTAALGQWAATLGLGPFGSVAENIIEGAELIADGDIYRGVEKAAPGFVKEPMEAYRLSQEGYVTSGGNRYADAEYYDAWRLTGQTLGFGSTKLARSQKAIFAYQELKQEAIDIKTQLYTDVEEAANRNLAIRTEYGPDSKQATRAQEKLDDVVNDIRAYNYKYFYNAITWESLEASLQEKLRREGLTKSGLYLGDKEAPYLYSLIQDMLLQPTMQELKKMQNQEDRDRNGQVILPDVGTGELRD